jgi:hypothetical protein
VGEEDVIIMGPPLRWQPGCINRNKRGILCFPPSSVLSQKHWGFNRNSPLKGTRSLRRFMSFLNPLPFEPIPLAHEKSGEGENQHTEKENLNCENF